MGAVVDAVVAAVLPWSVYINYGGLLLLFSLHVKHGGGGQQDPVTPGHRTKPFYEEQCDSWANGYVKLARWILGVVMAGSASCAGVVWMLMDNKQFDIASLMPENLNITDETQELAAELIVEEEGCVGPPGVCSFGWGVNLPIGVIFFLFHIFMLIQRSRGQQMGNTVSLFLCGAAQLIWMSLTFLWKRALRIDADSEDSLVWIDLFTNISTGIILLMWLIRAAYMFKYGLFRS